MDTLQLIGKRQSVREYKKKKFGEQDKKFLNVLFLEKPILKGDQSIEFVFIDHGWEAAEKLVGKAGYFGKMIQAPHYYAVLCHSGASYYKIAGYQGEWFVLKAIQENLGTCWIRVDDQLAAKEILGIKSDKELVALIAIGYPKKDHQQSQLFSATHKSSLSTLTDLGYPNISTYDPKVCEDFRKPITDFVYVQKFGNTTTLEELEQLGFHEALFYMRVAPSYENRQPWIFVIKEKEIDLLIEVDSKITPVIEGLDAGIAMLYFEIGMHASGIKGSWDFNESHSELDMPENYKLAGRYIF